jgi:hypothetical protein
MGDFDSNISINTVKMIITLGFQKTTPNRLPKIVKTRPLFK